MTTIRGLPVAYIIGSLVLSDSFTPKQKKTCMPSSSSRFPSVLQCELECVQKIVGDWDAKDTLDATFKISQGSFKLRRPLVTLDGAEVEICSLRTLQKIYFTKKMLYQFPQKKY